MKKTKSCWAQFVCFYRLHILSKFSKENKLFVNILMYKYILSLFFFTTFSLCSPPKLSNACDPSSESYLQTTLFRFLTNDTSPGCWPGFAKDFNLWGVHGPGMNILASYFDETRIILGGTFNYVGPNVGNVAVLNPSNGLHVNTSECNYVDVAGNASVAISDNQGGFYIGGAFTTIQGQDKFKIAHILSNCKLDPNFNPPFPLIASRYVMTMMLDGDFLYVGGTFTELNNITRSGIARLNVITGELDTSWNPTLGGSAIVYVMKKDANYLYIAGNFDGVNGNTRRSIARFQLSDGSLDTAWNPNFASVETIRDLALGKLSTATDVVIVVGDFSTPRIYAFETSGVGNGAAGWNSSPDGNCNTVQFYQDKIIVGGNFQNINGTAANYLAILDNTVGNVAVGTPNFDTNNEIHSSLVVNSQIYVFGRFTSILGTERNYGAGIDLNTYTVTEFNPNFSIESYVDTHKATLTTKNWLVVPGVFTSVNGVTRNNIAEISRITGKVTDWNQNIDGPVFKIKAYDQKIYVAGSFTNFSGEAKTQGFVALNQADLSLSSERFDIDTTPFIEDFEVSPSRVYAGGNFNSAQGITRTNMVAFLKETGTVDTAWDATVTSGGVSSILHVGDFLFVGGGFGSIGGISAQNYHRISASNGTGASLFFSEQPDNSVTTQYLWNNKIYFGGTFPIGVGITTPYFATYNLSTNSYEPSLFNFNAQINQIRILDNGKAFVVGNFSSINTTNLNQFVVLDLVNNTVTDYNPPRFGDIRGVYDDKKNVMIYGGFVQFNKHVQGGFTLIPVSQY